MHLKVETWHEPEISSDSPGIPGALDDIRRLARLVEEKAEANEAGDASIINEEYLEKNDVAPVFEVREDGFDPASADPHLDADGP